MEHAGQNGTFSSGAGKSGEDEPSTARDLGHEMQGAFRDAGRMVKDQARQAADDAKAQGGAQIAGVSRAAHKAADELSRELPQAAGFIRAAADRLDQASAALRERSVEELLSGFNGFARRQPAAAFAGSVLAGFALARFLKSSPARPKGNSNLEG
jgi:hypothetical protein